VDSREGGGGSPWGGYSQKLASNIVGQKRAIHQQIMAVIGGFLPFTAFAGYEISIGKKESSNEKKGTGRLKKPDYREFFIGKARMLPSKVKFDTLRKNQP